MSDILQQIVAAKHQEVSAARARKPLADVRADAQSRVLTRAFLGAMRTKIAAGHPISGKNYLPQKHSIECRINAEDPYNDFRPSPGKIEVLHKPGGHGVRIDSHIYAGYTIPPHYDSMIAKLIVSAQTREECIVKMERALSEFVIEGIKTTIPLHLKLMQDPEFRAGNFTTKFMETFDINK